MPENFPEETLKDNKQQTQNNFHKLKIRNMTDYTHNMLKSANVNDNPQNCITETIDISKIQIFSGVRKRELMGKKNDPTSCALCFDEVPDAVLMECGHGGICFRCGKKLYAMKEKCPLCRKEVILVLKIDTSNKHANFVKVIDYIDSRIHSLIPNI